MRFLKEFLFLSLLMIVGCQGDEKKDGDETRLLPQKNQFEKVIGGKKTSLFYLSNDSGMKAAITNYGGRVVGLIVPDKEGKPVDVVLGFASIDEYQASAEPYYGALIGRVGNRITNGRFSIGGVDYTVTRNNGPNTLHGGAMGFHSVVWDAEQESDSSLILKYFSPHGEEGFPGNLEVKVVYTLSSGNWLEMKYWAKTDALTPVNLTNHAFFNLNGEGSGTINNHIMMIDAGFYTPVDSMLIPTGELRFVENTPFDFRIPVKIGSRLGTSACVQLKYGHGYDHNFALNPSEEKVSLAARVRGDKTGIVMSVYTNEPGLQFYGGNFMKSENRLKSGVDDHFRTAFCLETQHFPDAVNQPGFPSVLLDKGEVFNSVSIYEFDVK